MATKKEKRAAALARREEFLRQERERNARVLRQVQEKRRFEEKKAWQANHDKRHSWKKRIKECPICQDELKSIPKDQQRLEEATAVDLETIELDRELQNEQFDESSMEMECI